MLGGELPQRSNVAARLGPHPHGALHDRLYDDRREIVIGDGPLLGQGDKPGPPLDMEITPGRSRQHPRSQLDDFAGSRSVLQFSE